MITKAVIIMGVSGSGKTTIGKALAQQLGWAFIDADDYHPASNRRKMACGEPLTDAERQPWLATLRELLAEAVHTGQPLVLACSALKEHYRRTLVSGLDGIQLVFANGSRELLAARMQQRRLHSDHFMPLSLLDSQLAALELPTQAIRVDIRQNVPDIVRARVRPASTKFPSRKNKIRLEGVEELTAC